MLKLWTVPSEQLQIKSNWIYNTKKRNIMGEGFEINLLHSRIVIGSHSTMNKNISYVEALKTWLHHKDTDWGMEEFKSIRTLYVSYLHVVELPLLKLIIEDLISGYQEHFPYAEKEDFIKYVF